MSDMIQYDLFSDTLAQKFEAWRLTPRGYEVTTKFINLAMELKRSGFKSYSARAIVYYLRFHSDLESGPNEGEDYKISNNHTPYLARYAMDNVTALQGFFRTAELGQRASRKAIVVPIQKESR